MTVFAHSGWISRAPQNSHCLDNDKWNYIALNHIARLIHFRFPRNIRDNANQAPESKYDGRAWAGHVEVLLASWYCAEMVKKVNPGKSEDWCIRHLRTLKQPTTTLGKRRHAIITIDSQACAYCHKFINQLQEYTGIFLTIRPSAGLGPTIVRVEGRTRRDTFADNFEDPDAMSEDEGRGHDEPMQMRWQAPALNPSSRSLLIPEASRVPENSQELLERFRRGTPVHDFPGYPPAPRPLGQTVTKRHVREAVGNREVVSSSDNQFQQTHNNVTRLEFRLQPETSQIQNDGQGHQDFVDLTADSDSEDPHTSPEPWDEEANDYVGSPTSVENGPQQPPELMTPSENLGNGLPFWQRHAYGVEDHSPYLETPRSRLNRFRHEPSSNTNLDGESGTTSVYSQRFPFLKARFTR
ncbi:hypothetical protein F5Y15DRAFT_137130 [Xylariaceae sp. FL0016]|nr:hypothetical protein F5Y15DRAFT_137130 [Xylariaceae sp. FL0016]